MDGRSMMRTRKEFVGNKSPDEEYGLCEICWGDFPIKELEKEGTYMVCHDCRKEYFMKHLMPDNCNQS